VTGAEPRESGGAAEVVRVNGRVANQVSALERGLHYGDGLFETIACAGGQPRVLGRHLRRLAAGCARLGIEAGDLTGLAQEVRKLASEVARSVVKVLVTRGPALARGYGVSGREQATRILLRYPWPEDDPALALQGVRVRIAAQRLGENPALAGLKHCNRLEQVLVRREWSDAEISESLIFSSAGALISGTMSNVFLVHDSTLLTPRVDRCGVAGIMREVVLEAAAALGVPAAERVLDEGDLARAQELFLTSALTGIRPVRELDGVRVAPGPVTRRLQAHLAPLLAGAKDTDPRAPSGGGHGD
jgi:4-amino-4-deoxychorismate lyase